MQRRQGGFTYLGLLLAIAVLGIALAAASEVWATTAKRQRLAELEWIGNQYVQAIGTFYESSPGAVKQFPRSIEDLLEDRRVPFVRRHLRQPYLNPMAQTKAWEFVLAPDGGIRGIRAYVADGSGDTTPKTTRDYAYSPGR